MPGALREPRGGPAGSVRAPRRPLPAAGRARRADPTPQPPAPGRGLRPAPAATTSNRAPAQHHRRRPPPAPPEREERWAGGEVPAPRGGRPAAGALSGRGSPPTRPAPPRPGRGLPLPLPLLRASRRETRLGQAAHSASAIFSPPSGGGAAQARWAPPAPGT